MAFNRRERLLVAVAIVCVSILAGERFVVRPLAKAWRTRSARIAELKSNLSQGALLLERRDMMERRWSDVKTRSLPSDLPAAESRVLNAVSGWANENRLQVTSLKPRWLAEEKATNGGGHRTVEFRLGATGTLDSVARFLYALETDSMPLRIETIEMASRDPRGASLGIDIRFTGLVILNEETGKP